MIPPEERFTPNTARPGMLPLRSMKFERQPRRKVWAGGIICWVCYGALMGAIMLCPFGLFVSALPWGGMSADLLDYVAVAALLGAIYGGLTFAIFLSLGLMVGCVGRSTVRLLHHLFRRLRG